MWGGETGPASESLGKIMGEGVGETNSKIDHSLHVNRSMDHWIGHTFRGQGEHVHVYTYVYTKK